MSSLDSLEIRRIARRANVGYVVTDSPAAIRFRWLGDGAVSSVTTATGTDLVLVGVDGGTTYTQTFPFGAGITLDDVGKLVDAINTANCTETAAVAGGVLWEAKVLDSLRSYPTTTQFINGTITASTVEGVSVYDVLVDTSAASYFAYRVTNNRLFDAVPGGHRVGIKLVSYYAGLTPAADEFQIWKVNGTTETQLVSALSVNNTDTTVVGSFNSDTPAIQGKNGEDLVVILGDTSLSDVGTNLMTVYEELE